MMSEASEARDCTCGWCQELREDGQGNFPRPVIRYGGLYLDVPGRCTRCHHPLGGTAFMMREKVFTGTIEWFNNAIMTEIRQVPVCEACVTDDERNSDGVGYPDRQWW